MNNSITQLNRKNLSPKLHFIQPIKELGYIKKSIVRLAIQSQDGIQLIKMEDITHIQSESNYSMIYLEGGARHLISKSLKHCQARLEKQGFIRTHQSYLVNDLHVIGLKNHPTPTILLKDGNTIPVSRRHHSEIKNYLITQYSI